MSRLVFFFFLGLALAIRVFTLGQDLYGDLSDDSFFSDLTQASLPSEPEESLDLTDPTSNQNPLAFDDARPLSGDFNILLPEQPDDAIFSPDEFFSKLFDPFIMADCPSLDSFSISSPTTAAMAMSRSRSKRSGQCAAPPPNFITNTNAYPSTPTVDDLDDHVRDTILRTYPTLGDQLQLLQDDDDENSACVLLSGGVMPRGACTSATH